jgi:3-methyladenine DNA glycosylase AlkD
MDDFVGFVESMSKLWYVNIVKYILSDFRFFIENSATWCLSELWQKFSSLEKARIAVR